MCNLKYMDKKIHKIYLKPQICIYNIYKFESHLKLYKAKIVLKTHIFVKYFAFFTEASSV